jgi:hypothetical protein
MPILKIFRAQSDHQHCSTGFSRLDYPEISTLRATSLSSSKRTSRLETRRTARLPLLVKSVPDSRGASTGSEMNTCLPCYKADRGLGPAIVENSGGVGNFKPPPLEQLNQSLLRRVSSLTKLWSSSTGNDSPQGAVVLMAQFRSG